MGNLFHRPETAGPHLTSALMALLEHSDRTLLAGLLRHVGLGGLATDEDELKGAEFLSPAPGGPPEAGEIRSPRQRLRILATGPGIPPPALKDDGVPTLVISPTGRAPAGAVGLSWEQLDRWLAERAGQYDPETRTGYLLRQFRQYLPELGITYFAGFDADRLAVLPDAHRQLEQFYREAAELFERLPGALPAGFAQLRFARPEDLLAGYCYRDYAGDPLGDGNFLRLAFHVPSGELQISCWFSPEGEAHGRLRAALKAGAESLSSTEPAPLLWLWSPTDERRMPLPEFDPEKVTDADWPAYVVAVQVGYPFAQLGGSGLTERIGGWVQSLLDRLRPVLSGVVH